MFNRRVSGGIRRLTASKSIRRTTDGLAIAARRRTAFMDNNLHQYQQTLLKANEEMARAIENMKLGLYDRWFSAEKINPLFLTFEDCSWELPFSCQADPLFKYYILCSLIVLLSILAIQGIKLSRTHWLPWIGYTVVGVFLLALQPIVWTHDLWNKYWDPHGDEGPVPPPQNCFLKFLHDTSKNLVKNTCARTCLYIVVCIALTACSTLELVECHLESLSSGNETVAALPWETGCVSPWNSETWNPSLEPQIAHVLYAAFLTISLHLIDRQSEYMNRLDFIWKQQLTEEQELSATTRMVNKMLLENILPSHVADRYLNVERTSDELYHEEYDSVAVLFATVTDYTLFDFDHPENSNEMVSLTVLNEIICDFDKLLFEPSFLRVEKIKVAGWTYMAACGLDPGRRDSVVSISRQNFSEHVVVVLARFAARMMVALQNINRDSMQAYRLRVGISHGPITAGVIGAQKPLYDIWGDAVNMASRMDSTGEAGRIQVTENTAKVLEEQGVCCECRGQTFVKGKNYMTTYFIKMGDNFQLISKPKLLEGSHEKVENLSNTSENLEKTVLNVKNHIGNNIMQNNNLVNHVNSNHCDKSKTNTSSNSISEDVGESDSEGDTKL